MAKKNSSSSSNLKKFVISSTLAATLAGSAFWIVKDNKPVQPLPSYQVKQVIDGDTFITTDNQHIRLRDAQAPDKGNCGYQQAKDELSRLILNKPVYLVVRYHDSYRLYAEVFTPDGEVNELMIKSGWARYDRSLKPHLVAARQHARQQGLGVYGSCITTTPDNPDCLIKGNINTKTGEKIYYFPGCISYNRTIVDKDLGESWFCNEIEAQQSGFRKALTCFSRSWP